VPVFSCSPPHVLASRRSEKFGDGHGLFRPAHIGGSRAFLSASESTERALPSPSHVISEKRAGLRPVVSAIMRTASIAEHLTAADVQSAVVSAVQ
jgi:hypothetical protein